MIGPKTRWMTGAMVGAGLLLGSISAAEARPRYGYGGGYGGGYGNGWGHQGGWDRHHRRGDGFGVGDAIGVAAIIGAVAIVANSMSKDKKVRDPIPAANMTHPHPAPAPTMAATSATTRARATMPTSPTWRAPTAPTMP